MDLTPEKVNYHIQAFMMFLSISKQTKTLSKEFTDQYLEKMVQLLESSKKNPAHAADQLNQFIKETNKSLMAPYPLLVIDSVENFVKSEIAAFEHYLNQELKANHLTIQQEGPLFNDSLKLWEQIGVSLSPSQGLSKFALIVEKLNLLLPDEEKYPFPDENQL